MRASQAPEGWRGRCRQELPGVRKWGRGGIFILLTCPELRPSTWGSEMPPRLLPSQCPPHTGLTASLPRRCHPRSPEGDFRSLPCRSLKQSPARVGTRSQRVTAPLHHCLYQPWKSIRSPEELLTPPAPRSPGRGSGWGLELCHGVAGGFGTKVPGKVKVVGGGGEL